MKACILITFAGDVWTGVGDLRAFFALLELIDYNTKRAWHWYFKWHNPTQTVWKKGQTIR